MGTCQEAQVRVRHSLNWFLSGCFGLRGTAKEMPGKPMEVWGPLFFQLSVLELPMANQSKRDLQTVFGFGVVRVMHQVLCMCLQSK